MPDESLSETPSEICLTPKEWEDICRLMVEGMSIRSIERFTGVHRDTILKLLVLVGGKCERIMARKVTGVSATYVQCDEVWAYVGCKQRKSTSMLTGDQYAFTALDMESKMLLAYSIGKRNGETAYGLMRQLSGRIEGAAEISTDAFAAIHPPDQRFQQEA